MKWTGRPSMRTLPQSQNWKGSSVTLLHKLRSGLVLLPLMLSACATSFEPPRVLVHKRSLVAVPTDIRQCITRMTGMPAPGAMDAQQAAQLIAMLRQSEYAKTRCGTRLLAIYDKQAKGR